MHRVEIVDTKEFTTHSHTYKPRPSPYTFIISVHGHGHGLLQLHYHTEILASGRIEASYIELVRLAIERRDIDIRARPTRNCVAVHTDQ